METKKEIRRWIRQKRQEMSEEIWVRDSKAVTDTLITHPWFLDAMDICTYAAYNREVRTQEMIDAAFEMGKNVWVPKVMGEVMHFFRIRSMSELKPGVHGILEPAGDTGKNARMDGPGEEPGSLMIMPGTAFDESCRRIGYGGGYYDRYLAQYPKLRTIALAFEFQVFPRIPCEAHDICPDILITEKQLRKS